jgi:hypothetical protein
MKRLILIILCTVCVASFTRQRECMDCRAGSILSAANGHRPSVRLLSPASVLLPTAGIYRATMRLLSLCMLLLGKITTEARADAGLSERRRSAMAQFCRKSIGGEPLRMYGVTRGTALIAFGRSRFRDSVEGIVMECLLSFNDG